MVRRLTLLCHAATDAQRRGEFPAFDEPISEASAAILPKLRADRIISAPEKRAQQTAVLLNAPFTVDETLRDCDFGTWIGSNLQNIFERDPAGAEQWLTDPMAKPHGGESLNDTLDRASRWLRSFSENSHVLVLTHPSVMRAIVIEILSSSADAFWKIDIEPLAMIDARYDGRRWSLRALNQMLSKNR